MHRKHVELDVPMDLSVDPEGIKKEIDPIHRDQSIAAYETLDSLDGIADVGVGVTGTCTVQQPDLFDGMSIPESNKMIRHQVKPPATQLGYILRTARARFGLTHREVSEKIGLSRREVGSIEQGIPEVPKLEKVMLFVDFYKLDKKLVLRSLQQQMALSGLKRKSMPKQIMKVHKSMAEVMSSRIDPTTKGPFSEFFLPKTDPVAQIKKDEYQLTLTKNEVIRRITDVLNVSSMDTFVKIANYAGVRVKGILGDLYKLDLDYFCMYCSRPMTSDNIHSISKSPIVFGAECPTCKGNFVVYIEQLIEANLKKPEVKTCD